MVTLCRITEAFVDVQHTFQLDPVTNKHFKSSHRKIKIMRTTKYEQFITKPLFWVKEYKWIVFISFFLPKMLRILGKFT